MGKCAMCGNRMNHAPGCIEHEILLEDASVIESPRHTKEGSLNETEPTERCNDCGATPGGYHHAHCDWARQPDGRQVLIEAVDYRKPGESWDDDVVFLAVQDTNEVASRAMVFDTREALDDYLGDETIPDHDHEVLATIVMEEWRHA